jgi:hypothetical protein
MVTVWNRSPALSGAEGGFEYLAWPAWVDEAAADGCAAGSAPSPPHATTASTAAAAIAVPRTALNLIRRRYGAVPN